MQCDEQLEDAEETVPTRGQQSDQSSGRGAFEQSSAPLEIEHLALQAGCRAHNIKSIKVSCHLILGQDTGLENALVSMSLKNLSPLYDSKEQAKSVEAMGED